MGQVRPAHHVGRARRYFWLVATALYSFLQKEGTKRSLHLVHVFNSPAEERLKWSSSRLPSPALLLVLVLVLVLVLMLELKYS